MTKWRTSALVAAVGLSAVVGVGAVAAVNQNLTASGSLPAVSATTTSAPETKTAATTTSSISWQPVATSVRPSVVAISVIGHSNSGQTKSGQGSGVVLDDKGHIVTNHHVVAGGERFRVVASDGRVFDQVTLVGSDATTDLAVLRVSNPTGSLKPVAKGDSNTVKPGQAVMALGNPLGLADTVTTGIVSAIDRPVKARGQRADEYGRSEPVVTNAIQTDAAINPGNSGGALVNAQGQLVGINSSIYSMPTANGNSGSIGLGFAIPSNEAYRVAEELIQNGVATHAWLGVDIRDAVTTTPGNQRQASRVAAVVEGSPAARAGLQAGDYVMAIDGEPVRSGTSLVAQLRERAAGTTVKLSVLRDDQQVAVEVTLGQRPQ